MPCRPLPCNERLYGVRPEVGNDAPVAGPQQA